MKKSYKFTAADGTTKTFSQGDAEALLVSSGHCDNAKEAKEQLALGDDIQIEASTAGPAGTLSCEDD